MDFLENLLDFELCVWSWILRGRVVYILLLWTELGSSGLYCWSLITLLPCTKHSRLALPEKKPESFYHIAKWNLLFFFSISWCSAGTRCCAVSPEGVAGTSSCQGLCGVCLPTTAVPSPGPLQALPPRGEVSLCSICHGRAGTVLLRFTCVYQGVVQPLRWQGSFIAWSVRAGLLCSWLWVLLWAHSLLKRTVLNLHPLLTEDNEPAFGTAPPLATHQVTLKQRWILWTLMGGGWRQGCCYFIFSVDGVVSVVVWRWVETGINPGWQGKLPCTAVRRWQQ